MRDAELVGIRIEQPIADLAILFGAMELGQQRYRNTHQKQELLHGSLRAIILTGNWSSRSLRKLRRRRPSESVETMAGEAQPITSHPGGRTTVFRLIPRGRSKMSCPSFKV